MTQETVTLDQAMEMADQVSPAPWIACQAMRAMRAEILRLRVASPAHYQQWVNLNWNRRGYEREQNELRELYIMGLGIGGEAGEVQELLKKHVRDDREIVDDLLLELGDVLHYLTRIASQFGITLEEVMAANHEKIERRHAKRLARDAANG